MALGMHKAALSAFVNGAHSLKLAHKLRLHSVDSESAERYDERLDVFAL